MTNFTYTFYLYITQHNLTLKQRNARKLVRAMNKYWVLNITKHVFTYIYKRFQRILPYIFPIAIDEHI